MATTTAAASLTPSLLPKTPLVQGVVTGMAASLGYACGTLGLWILTPIRRRVSPTVRARGGWVLFIAAILWLLPAAWQGQVWQRKVAASVGVTNPPQTNALVALVLALAVTMGTLLIARTLRLVTRLTSRWLAKSLPQWLAIGLAVLSVVGLTTAVTYQILRHRVLTSVDQSFRLVNMEATAQGPAPADTLRSGGPGSLVRWSTLGRAGREFVSLRSPSGGQRPIRVYAGMDSAPDLGSRAGLVVAELVRTGGLQRGVVCLVVPTGTGWVDPATVTALEALWSGDSAVASMQYSYLPSVLSLTVDRFRVDAAATALLGAVVRQWRTLPSATRPRLVLYGESLGSHGVEAAMRDVPGAADLVDGVLLAGPLNSNPTWSRLVSHRDAGSPLLAPVVDGGRSVRFWPGPEMPTHGQRGQVWPMPQTGPRVLYLQHPSDPIVWWSPSLLWSEPAWVRERTTVSRAPSLRWRPIVTFWQISGDVVFSIDTPRGHGHRYGSEMSAAWAAVVPRTAR